MGKHLKYLILILVLLAVPAVAENYSNGTTQIWLIMTSGGSLELGNGATKMHDAKGYPFVSPYTNGATTIVTGLGSLYVPSLEQMQVPPGTVPLYISRFAYDGDGIENDIKITWEAGVYGQPMIYVRKGDGTGQYINTYSTDNWKKILYAGTVLDVGPGYGTFVQDTANELIHKSQVGEGLPEVYYKGLLAGINENSDSPLEGTQTYFETARAVGKVNAALAPGTTIVCYPFDTGSAGKSLSEAFGAKEVAKGNKFSADLVMCKADATKWSLPSAFIDQGGAWRDYDSGTADPTFAVKNNAGYYIWRRAATTTTISMIGTLTSESSYTFIYGSVIKPTTVFGLGLPVSVSLPSSGLSANQGDKFHADLVMYKAFVDKWVLKSAFKNSSGEWKDYDTPADPAAFTLQLPFGYYYWNRCSADVAWKRNL